MYHSDNESFKNYYQILGLDENADEKQIKTAYRRLALTFHPDKNPGDKTALEKFKKITEAYGVLIDPVNGFWGCSPIGHNSKYSKIHYADTQIRQSNILSTIMDRLKTGLFKTVRQVKVFWDSIETEHDIEDKRSPKFHLEITPQEAIQGATKVIRIKTEEGIKKYRIKIPAGIKDGLNLKIKDENSKPYYLIIKVSKK